MTSHLEVVLVNIQCAPLRLNFSNRCAYRHEDLNGATESLCEFNGVDVLMFKDKHTIDVKTLLITGLGLG